jgi:glycosyltransferase involved in cell wall biosynthesis
MIQSVLILSPEPPYPLHGGGAYRVASLMHYFARFAHVDLVLFSDSGKAAVLPPGLVRSQAVIPLPVHRNSISARYVRNARRAFQGVPPLVDRLGGHEPELARILSGRHYDLGIVEHSWCAPYLQQMSVVCDRTVLDLHNIESVLHARCAEISRGLVAAGQRRFARCSRELEAALLPGYSLTLVTSETDAATARNIAPDARVVVYPNAIPATPEPGAATPESDKEPVVVFSGNFEYHPNIDAVSFLVASIWPEVRKRCPELRLRLVGRGDKFIRHLLPSGLNIEVTGSVDDALSEIGRARIAIAPLRCGSGTRIKILEAWAARCPMIATSLALEGLDYERGRDVLIADQGCEFGAEIAHLNEEPARRSRIAVNGRRLFEERYTWQAAWRVIDNIPLMEGANACDSYTENSDANRR